VKAAVVEDIDPVAETDADDAAEAGLIFARKVREETDRLRVRDLARRTLRREQRGKDGAPCLPTSLADFLDVPDPAIGDRIEGLLPIGGRVILAAQYKAGKSTVVGNLVRSMADGDPFLDRFEVHQPRGRIVVADAELDQRTLRRWLRDQDIRQPARAAVLALRGRVSSFDILDPDTRREWAELLRRAYTDVLVLDCLRPFLDALGLSEDKDAGRFLTALDELLAEAEIDEAIVVHHMGHVGERSRGDSRILDWPDATWRLLREIDEDGRSDPGTRRYFSAYGRDVEVPEGLLTFDPHNRRLQLTGGSRRETAADIAIPVVLALLEREPGLSGRQIEAALKDSEHGRDRIRAALKKAITAGQIDTTDGPRNSTLHFASSTPAVRECAGSAR